MAWLLLKDTIDSCMEYRVTGLAAEAAFFVLLSLPPLLLSLVGALGYLDKIIGIDTVENIRQNILTASATVLTDRGVDELVRPLVNGVFKDGRPDLISLGFMIALWSGSRAVNVFIDTITVMYGLDGRRGIVMTRLLSFGLYIVALIIGAVVMPLMVVGPDAVVGLLPWSEAVIRVLYWPVVLVLSIVFLTTLYHVSVPVRSPWYEDMPGAGIALMMWVLGSIVLRVYLTHAVEGPTIYGSLAAPVAVLLWIGVSAFAVLVGAAVNAAVDRVWPSLATAAAREEAALAREAEAAEVIALAAARRAASEAEPDDEIGGDEMPAEFPERWTRFLPPEDVRARLRKRPPVGRRKREAEPEPGPEREPATGPGTDAQPSSQPGPEAPRTAEPPAGRRD
ncbi:YihY/virulence factor BrkB family protein [Actinacidiphila oryziradicis]|uniref:YihY/virulence factor BrkB family protein n=2 Tax=Actinacidiphila oryziradicis TaxID=2571141 RepID=A0A4U0SRY6_9ACTN|nr:YihY/virulence factor BrkB family protein [Actinacidiphila oryziradicis]TKA11111.1 YihY/virulence factor BrkB family protein [Actinacidiphila oryziradicis]